MDYAQFKSDIKSKGYCFLEREQDVDWDSWMEEVKIKKKFLIESELPGFNDNTWWDQSRNTKWRNQNNVELEKDIPSQKICSFIKRWIDDYDLKRNELAQFAILLDGYPDMDCPPYVDKQKYLQAYESYLQGNIHIDGSDHPNEQAEWTSALLVGVFLSRVDNQVGAGRPIYFPGSHIDVMKHVLAGKSRKETRREVMKQFGCMRAHAHGEPGDVIIYHGAMLHGMEPNRSGVSRDMLYFRKHFEQDTDRRVAYQSLLNE